MALGRPNHDQRPLRAPMAGHVTRGWAVTFIGSLVYLAAVFHRMLLGAHGNQTAEIFRLSPLALGLLPAASFLVYALAQVPVGLAADRTGPRRLLLFAVAAFAAGGTLFAVTSEAWLALFARILLGCGDACTFLSVLRLAATWLPTGHFVLAAAMANAMGAAGQLLAAYPLSVAIETWGWSNALLGASLGSLALAVPLLVLVRDQPHSNLAVSPSSTVQVRDVLRRSFSSPLTRLGMWLHATLMAPFLLLTALWGYPYLVQSQRASSAHALGAVSLSVASFAVGSVVIVLAAKQNPAKLSWALSFAGISLAGWATIIAWPEMIVPTWANLLLFIGTGLGAAGVNIAFALARQGSELGLAGLATGLVNMASFATSALFIALIGVIVQSLENTSVDPRLIFRVSFSIVPALMVVGLVRVRRLYSLSTSV